jgi:hypothetical protein
MQFTEPLDLLGISNVVLMKWKSPVSDLDSKAITKLPGHSVTRAVVLNWGPFCTTGTFHNVWDQFELFNWRKWHLVNRGQGC